MYRDQSVGLSVSVELFDEPDADRAEFWPSDISRCGENIAGMRGFEGCQSIISTTSDNQSFDLGWHQ